MKVKRIFAPDMRQAMRRVRDEIGPDAVIISNHRVAGGVEVVAAREDEYEAAQAELKRSRSRRQPPNRDEQIRILTGGHSHQSEQASRNAALEEELNRTRARIAEASRRITEPTPVADRSANRQIDDEDDEDLRSILESLRARNRQREVPSPPSRQVETPRPASRPVESDTLPADDDALLSMQQEIQELRNMLQQQVARPEPAAPVFTTPATAPVQERSAVHARLEQLGLGSQMVQQLMSGVEPELAADKAWRNALARLSDALPVLGEELVERGGMIAFVGPTGVGKTTTIGKLAKKYQTEGKSVMLAAGDTFRAAAVEQLQVWGERNNVPVVAQHTGADSASVIFDALQSAQSKGVDVLIADTAGRLQNKDNLMQELQKVVRVMQKLDPDAPHEVMLVLDAGTGQNAISQAKQFKESVGVTGITLTKLDGTAKGGIIFAIAKQFGLPIRFIGVGEQVDDLRPFEADEFVHALFD